MKRIGVLALQGAVTEHITMLEKRGAQGIAVKRPSELLTVDGLILPGGESTAISRLIVENDLYAPIRQFAAAGHPLFGTCAGLILMAKQLTCSHRSNLAIKPLALMDITVERNGFGRQVESFEAELEIPAMGQSIPAVFIRAPYIVAAEPQVEIIAHYNHRIVMARQNNLLVAAFHPELTNDGRVMDYFLQMVSSKG